jgi:cytoskeletal protein CcmA (bactofilin family)
MWKRDEPVKPSSPSSGRTVEVTPRGPLPSVEPVAAKKPEEREVVMDLGKSVVIKGELSASEDLTLYGQMEGSVTLPNHTLTIGPHAEIKAAIAAKAVVVMGAVTGNVTAGERIEIQNTGSVNGDVVSPRLAIADGGSLRGKVQMPQTRASQPARAAV